MTAKKFYIVWNEGKNEGFVTDDFSDASAVRDGEFYGAYSTAGNAFWTAYEDEELSLQAVEIDPEQTA